MSAVNKIVNWIDDRADFKTWSGYLLFRKLPPHIGWAYTLGSATLITFVLLVITGIFLMVNYSPSPDHAWDSVQFISDEVTLGWLIRGVHHWAASAMVVLMILHAIRVFFMAAYRFPRELTWVVGMLLLVLVLGSSFTGYLLPWDQKAYWATTVGIRIAGTTPIAGDFIVDILKAGPEMGAATLTRFYALHVAFLPVAIGSLLGVHLYLVVKNGISEPPQE